MKRNNPSLANQCPRKAAIRALSDLIEELQGKSHAIILAIDANQTPKECVKRNSIIRHTIEWLKMEYNMSDPFIDMIGSRPPSTTLTPHRDIDYILTYGIDVKAVTTLGINFPAISDHQGIAIDIDVRSFFNGSYSTLGITPGRRLTLNNARAKQKHKAFIKKETVQQRLSDKVYHLLEMAKNNTFGDEQETLLNKADDSLSEILLGGERQCADKKAGRDPWSPSLCTTGRTLVYWKKKYHMAKTKHFNWNILRKLHTNTMIIEEDHKNNDISFIKQRLRTARQEWKEVKSRGSELRRQFLIEQAEDYACKLKTTPEKALHAIIKAEESKHTYNEIREIIGSKERIPLTQIEIPDPVNVNNRITLTTKIEMEQALTCRNQKHARQSLQTPFATIPSLLTAIDPHNNNNKHRMYLMGHISFRMKQYPNLHPLNRNGS